MIASIGNWKNGTRQARGPPARFVSAPPRPSWPALSDRTPNSRKTSMLETLACTAATNSRTIGSRRENSWMSGLALDAEEVGPAIEFGERADVNARLRKTVGERVIEARSLNGLSQGDCSTAMGWSNPTQQNLIELGRRLPPMALLVRFSEVLGVTVDFLLGLESEPDRDPKQAAKRAVLRHVHGMLKQHACLITEAVHTHVLTEAAAGMASSALLRAADTAVGALRTFCELNPEAFLDMRGGAWLVRAADEFEAAAADARREKQRHERALQIALQRAPASNDAEAPTGLHV